MKPSSPKNHIKKKEDSNEEEDVFEFADEEFKKDNMVGDFSDMEEIEQINNTLQKGFTWSAYQWQLTLSRQLFENERYVIVVSLHERIMSLHEKQILSPRSIRRNGSWISELKSVYARVLRSQ